MTDHLTENARLRAALEWYADEANYETQYERLPCECCTDIFEPISNDRGELARNTLNHRKEVMPDDEAANPADARHEASPGVTAGADYAAGFAEGIRRAAEVCEIRLTDASFEGDWAKAPSPPTASTRSAVDGLAGGGFWAFPAIVLTNRLRRATLGLGDVCRRATERGQMVKSEFPPGHKPQGLLFFKVMIALAWVVVSLYMGGLIVMMSVSEAEGTPWSIPDGDGGVEAESRMPV